MTKISVIGLRAYPSKFEGTSGLEVYTEKVVAELLKKSKSFELYFFTRAKYQNRVLNKDKRVSIMPLKTINSKVLETFYYSLIASLRSCFNSSEVVWYHGVGPAIFSFIPKLFGKKVVLTVHSLDWERKKWGRVEKYIFKTLVPLSFFGNYKTFCVSKDLGSYVKAKFGIPSVLVLPGIDVIKKVPSPKILKKYGINRGSYILYLGRIVPEKRIEWLIEEFLLLKSKYKDLRLVVAGGHGNLPVYEQKLKSIYKDLGIIWTGYVFGEEKDSLLYYCRCFVLPSELEGNSVSFMEALERGCLCVVGKENGNEFTDLDNVFLFENSRGSFSKTIKKVLTSSSKNKYSNKNKRVLSRYSWSKTAAAYYRNIL